MLNPLMMKSKNIYAIIAAGGIGTRFGTEMPKQFFEIDNKPIIIQTMLAFKKANPDIQIIVSLHAKSVKFWKDNISTRNDCPKHILVSGGETRFHSIKNALQVCPDEGIVLIHDAVRPFISTNLIYRIIDTCHEKGNAIPYIAINDSLRQISSDGNVSVDRKNYVRIQTPQGFQLSIIKKAYQQEYSETFTDDASVIETIGEKIHLVEGEEKNIKITLKEDIGF